MPLFAKKGYENAGIEVEKSQEEVSSASDFSIEIKNEQIDLENSGEVFLENVDNNVEYSAENEEYAEEVSDIGEEFANLEDKPIEEDSQSENSTTKSTPVLSGKTINAIAVKLLKNPKMLYIKADNLEVQKCMGLVLETERGQEYAVVQKVNFEIDVAHITNIIKRVVRLADDSDLAQLEKFNKEYKSIIKKANEMALESKLQMHVVDAEYTIDGQKLALYFTSDGRVDFRELIRKLATAFKARIELKQIGPRDEVKQKGALGCCGRQCCCAGLMENYASVSIKMAKNQGISLNPTIISGLCGRLKCCLSYENTHYAELNRHLPKIGAKIKTKDGKEGTVIKLMHLKEKVRLKIVEKDAFIFSDYTTGELIFKSRAERESEEVASGKDTAKNNQNNQNTQHNKHQKHNKPNKDKKQKKTKPQK